jgi:hypothetical protein
MAWTTPLTAVANVALTAAQWNASVRDNLNFLHRSIAGVNATATSDSAFSTSETNVVSAPSITGNGTTKVKITISWFGITPNAGVTTGKCMIVESGTRLAQCRWITDNSVNTSVGGSLHVVVTPSAAAHTYEFMAIRESGPAGSVVAALSTAPATITVEEFR